MAGVNGVDYRAYMRSDAWKARRTAALHRSTRNGVPRCEVCGRGGRHHKNNRAGSGNVWGSSGLEVHHLHYRNLGQEEPADLIVLCTDVCYIDEAEYEGRGCHERVHADRTFRAQVDAFARERNAR